MGNKPVHTQTHAPRYPNPPLRLLDRPLQAQNPPPPQSCTTPKPFSLPVLSLFSLGCDPYTRSFPSGLLTGLGHGKWSEALVRSPAETPFCRVPS